MSDDEDFGDFEDFKPHISDIAPALTAADFKENALDRIRAAFPAPPAEDQPGETNQEEENIAGDTSLLLWKHLTEDTHNIVPDWNSSHIHKMLAVRLGVPLNLDLDRSLPRGAPQRRMELPSDKDDELQQQVPEWRLLSTVSAEALDGMSESELEAHVLKLQEAVKGAQELKQSFEDREMDLEGEQNVLEGMVESLLVYSQRKHREGLVRSRR